MMSWFSNFCWLLLGLLVWFPANAIADELPVLVDLFGNKIAAIVTVSFQIGNLPLFILTNKVRQASIRLHRCLVFLSMIVGTISIVVIINATKGTLASEYKGYIELVVLSSVLAGVSGSFGSSSLWALASETKSNSATKFLSIGMALSCMLSGIMIAFQQAGPDAKFTSKVYFLAVFCTHLFFSMFVFAFFISKQDDYEEANKIYDEIDDNKEDDDNLLDYNDDSTIEDEVASTVNTQKLFFLFSVLYFGNYFFPSFLPLVLESSPTWAYRAIIISCNAGDLVGRIFLIPHLLNFKFLNCNLWFLTCSLCVLFSKFPNLFSHFLPNYFIIVAVVFFFFLTYARGTLVTQIQLELKKTDNPKKSAATASVCGQLGSLLGSLLGLMLVFLIN